MVNCAFALKGGSGLEMRHPSNGKRGHRAISRSGNCQVVNVLPGQCVADFSLRRAFTEQTRRKLNLLRSGSDLKLRHLSSRNGGTAQDRKAVTDTDCLVVNVFFGQCVADFSLRRAFREDLA